MINSIKISGYRGFSDFSMTGLGRINLLVGRNNTGKTSILEALHLLASGSDLSALWRILLRRGEQPVFEPSPGRAIQQEIDLSHLFHGHELAPGMTITITTSNQQPERTIRYQIDEATPSESPVLFAQIANEEPAGTLLALKILGPARVPPPIPLVHRTSMRNDTFNSVSNMVRAQKFDGGAVQYITNESLSFTDLINLWNTIVLTPEEERVVDALKAIDPNIERIASIGGPVIYSGVNQRAGFAVKMRGTDKRVPIGSFGDGVWRIVALAAAISRAKDGILLVDEIDTGLHYTVMEAMWRTIDNASKAFNVQVFATTHSFDCVHSLAALCNSKDEPEDAITIQRIEANKNKAVAFTQSQIRMVAERDIEVR
jgi:energy-coupling factor transporter ATP-binding protein EcfA2